MHTQMDVDVVNTPGDNDAGVAELPAGMRTMTEEERTEQTTMILAALEKQASLHWILGIPARAVAG